jgi:hypothetical protein
MYLEAVAMLPQIYMFQRQASDQGGIVEVREGDMEGDRDGDKEHRDRVVWISILVYTALHKTILTSTFLSAYSVH